MNIGSFKIRGLDCAEEVAILKREIGPVVGGKEHLAFDVLNGRMTILETARNMDETKIIEVVSKTGMEAIPWQLFCERQNNTVEEGFWQRRGRALMCISSGICVLTGFGLQVIHNGSLLKAFSAGGDSGNPVYLPAFLLYLVAVITGGWFIAPKTMFAARRLRPDMNLLMSIAVLGAMAIGEWFEAGSVTFLFALALFLESWSVGQARKAIGALMDLSPVKARYICPHDGDIEEKPVDQVPTGVTVLVRPGEKIPLDGVITKGITSVDQSPITGESIPVTKERGDEVFAGTINNEGAIEFKATKPSSDTTLARIIQMVDEAQCRRAPTEQWVEKFARYYTPAMMGFAVFIATVPPLLTGGDWERWFYQGLVVLVIACPCALVISTPVSIVAGLASAARAGVLIKGGAFLELPARLKAVALDKTGTLTRGKPEVQEIFAFNNHDARELLSIAASLESQSEHPLAKSILRKAQEENTELYPVDGFRSVRGKGAEATINGCRYWIGSHRFMHEKKMETDEIHAKVIELECAGRSTVVLGNERHICGIITIADEIRENVVHAVAALKKSGIERVRMLTGDNPETARAVAVETGVDEFEANLLPEDKVQAIEKLVQEFKTVAMLGDGVNDAPAMAVSTLGIAMGAAGSDAAIETADIALMSDDLTRVPWLIHHSKSTLNIIKQNIRVALGLKATFMVLALAGMATLWMAIAADMGASLLVIFNSLRLLRRN